MLGVTFHDDPLRVAERGRLAEDVIRHADLADVVKQSAAPQRREILGSDGQLRDDELHVLDHAARMTFGLAVADVERIGQRLQRRVVGALGLRERGAERLRLRHDLTRRPHVDAAQDQPQEKRGQRDDRRGRHLHLAKRAIDQREVAPHDRGTDKAVAFTHRYPHLQRTHERRRRCSPCGGGGMIVLVRRTRSRDRVVRRVGRRGIRVSGVSDDVGALGIRAAREGGGETIVRSGIDATADLGLVVREDDRAVRVEELRGDDVVDREVERDDRLEELALVVGQGPLEHVLFEDGAKV